MVPGGRTTYSTDCLNSFIVSDKGGRLIFPKTIPNVRAKITTWIVIFTILLCFICTSYLNHDVLITVEAINYAILNLYVVEVLYRSVLSLEELLHCQARYRGDITEVFLHTFHFSFRSMLILVVAAITGVYFFMDHGYIEINKLHKLSILSILLLLLLLKKLIKIEDAPIYSSLRFEENDGLNYSSSMAHSFFHGYLRLILPKTGGEDKNLTEIIEIYSDKNNVEVFPKLFILVPRSGVCPVSLEGTNIEESRSLEEKKLTIAGVQKRVYKNSVYKIKDPKRPKEKVYVCAEYATPLRTFRLALDSSGRYTETFRKHIDDIILHFYLITRDLVKNDPEVCDLCELIYYDDRDEKGTYRDVSPILLRSVKKNEKKKRK